MLLPDDIARLLAARQIDPKTFDTDAFVDALPDQVALQIATEILKAENDWRFNRFANLFPETGPFRRELYPRHMEFFEAGRDFLQRCFMAANRVGKTVAGAYEVTAHLTGEYPAWWPGRVFRRPGEWWAAGDTNETTRDIIQKELLGEITYDGATKTFDGSGMIPKRCIGDVTWKRGVADLADTVLVKHRTGRWAKLGLKSYDQGRRVFQGTAKQGIWLDEEPPEDVYGECLIRLATTRGLMMLTFTPLLGLSNVTLTFMGEEFQAAKS